MKPEIGISAKHLEKSISMLTSILADEMTLYIKTRKFHWNVKGQSFMELHKLFELHYSELEEIIDAMAERISKLGGNTIGTMKEFTELTRLKESPGHYGSQKEMLKELLGDHETIVVEARKDIEKDGEKVKDQVTIDFLIKIMQQHETIAWVLRRYLS
jgi:starvation-inducible DNA-binding protein